MIDIVIPAATWLAPVPFGCPIMPEGFLTTTWLFVSGFVSVTGIWWDRSST